MHRWALTGGIASGKSTVAKMFVGAGVPVIDADAIYHNLIAPDGASGQPSPLALQVAAAFAGVMLPDGSLDRPRLGAQVFASTAARATLEAITHPAVHARAQMLLDELENQNHTHALYDVPLLFERNLAANFEQVVVVWVPPQLQLTRMLARDGLSKEAALLRLASQAPLTDKRARADHVIDNSGSQDETRRQVQNLVQTMRASI